MMGAGKNIEAPENSVFNRYDSAKLKEFNVDKGPSHSPWINAERRDSALQRFYFGKTLNEFLANEKVAGVLY
ncbi:MAG: hypothetical protein ABJK37_03095 [Paraglaciecola sp.]|uniref:hypothetical protein n=1 Tax=Paraglaciecola sp. TaxID=1920173 RepID=UPI003298ED3A